MSKEVESEQVEVKIDQEDNIRTGDDEGKPQETQQILLGRVQ